MSESSGEEKNVRKRPPRQAVSKTTDDNSRVKRARSVKKEKDDPDATATTTSFPISTVGPPLKKSKRTAVVPDATVEKDIEKEEEPVETVGGPDPIIIHAPDKVDHGPGTHPDVALLTATADTRDYIESDYLYQALKQLRENDLFADLLTTVTSQGPDDWGALVASQYDPSVVFRSMPDDVLTRMAKVDPSVGIVVVDGVGFDDLEVGRANGGPLAAYNSILHVIEHNKVTSKDAPYALKNGGGYWTYFHGVLFELCNASQRTAIQAIDKAAADGDLDCVSFVLAKETLEAASEDLHDQLMTQALQDKACHTVRDEGASTTSVLPSPQPAKMLYGNISDSRAARLTSNVKKGHALGYVDAWKRDYAAQYKAKNAESFAQFEQWLAMAGDPPAIDHAAVVHQFTGINVTKDEVTRIQDHTRETYANPDTFDPEAAQSDDEDFVLPTTTPTKSTKPKSTKSTKTTKKPPTKRRKTGVKK
ncbi:hypothetical protein GCM10009530_39900 [Microbispora corallina]|uniref:Uncharacterized protein n=1 Tax=Microbispora corallina TaxID=83302 RepID=A0ABQ4G8Q8_9ACTN|nr:hypothetical protein [Microbispora corallina]GIH43463.1 hypothetical protein Mco01_64630 [Microbispora corallina]